MKFKAVISDVDGTLIAPSEDPKPIPSPKVIKAVLDISKKGLVFSLASGRSLTNAQSIIDSLKISSPVILDNGATIYHCGRKKYVWQSVIPIKTAKEVFHFLHKDKTLRVFVVDNGVRLDSISKIQKWKINRILVLGMIPQKAENLRQKLKIFPKLYITKSVTGVNPIRESILITNYDATKQIAITKIAKILGISTKEILGIGDSYNDFPLLMACGFKVAMGNAIADIKAIADYIAPSFEEDGVAHVLEKFILNEKNHLHNISGEDKNQLLVVTDRQGNKLGSATREECHKGDGITHLAFMAFIINGDGKIVLTKRSKRKSLWRGFWDASVVSHVLPGESAEEAAKRRGKEELGIEVDFKDLGAFYYFAKHESGVENEYCHVLIGQTDKKIYHNPIEIEEVKLVKFEEVVKLVNNTPRIFAPWLKLAIEKFEIY